ncbi:MAG: DEAD/DEAH box helicase [Phycisphaeraceae bacterium]|nr:DEAD/DEAH box helicase [Phycisphaeraceae bacterium]
MLHAVWTEGSLHLWGEASSPADRAEAGATDAPLHPLAVRPELLGEIVRHMSGGDSAAEPSLLRLRLPARESTPLASPSMAHAAGATSGSDAAATLEVFGVPSVALPPVVAAWLLERLDEIGVGFDGAGERGHVGIGPGIRFFAAGARLARHLLAQQRFVPSLMQVASGEVRGVWQPWLADGPTVERVDHLLSSMPPICRAVVDARNHDAWGIIGDFLLVMTDALCRDVLIRDTMADAIDGRDPTKDAHVSWLQGLLGPGDDVPAGLVMRGELVRRVHRWISSLEDRGVTAQWRLLLRLTEPLEVGPIGDLVAPDDSLVWTIWFNLQAVRSPRVIIDASDIWLLPGGAVTVGGERIEQPHDVLLAELGRAARLYKKLESALGDAQPTKLELTTSEAYRFLREVRPILLEQGIEVEAPAWWDQPTIRVGARLQVESEDIDLDAEFASPGASHAATARLGLRSLVNYRWQLAIGDVVLTLEQFQKLAAQHSPLVRLHGRWVEVRPDDIRAAMDFLGKNPGGQMPVSQLLRLAYASDQRQTGLPITGMDATGWVARVFGGEGSGEAMPVLQTPEGFVGLLRPYQVKGLSWLAFLDRFGLGACLADDMGLGKTIQLLALLAFERMGRPEGSEGSVGPTLLVAPMSVVGNWVHEARRFTPTLRVMVHHGMERLGGDAMVNEARGSDLVITTYALAHRDREQLSLIPWNRVALDEAQNIKNPGAKQTQAIRSIPSERRVALTGTPVENRLSELWSIMDFLNPGHLGAAGEFRSRFAVPIERYHDSRRSEQLRQLVRPFVLRRLKTDSSVISDLPEKIESREYCYLTPEQASLYKTCVNDMLSAADRAEGMQRRGLVLAGLIKLKQICNHPAQFYKETSGSEADGGQPPKAERSGKSQRLVEMLGEVVDSGDRALVFTQFRQMGLLLASMLRHDLDREVLLLHGGTPAAAREAMIRRFQSGDPACPIFVLSLKAGGLGLNLTAANHVFHFDRWWNPAVESQATDRAYRIGQTRSVQVHKFVVAGTLEERIDQMIQEKTDLADQVIGSGERWLTELSTARLRELLTLRPDAVGEPATVEVGEAGEGPG